MLRTVLVLILAGTLVACGDNGAQPNQPDMDYAGNAQRWIADEFSALNFVRSRADSRNGLVYRSF